MIEITILFLTLGITKSALAMVTLTSSLPTLDSFLQPHSAQSSARCTPVDMPLPPTLPCGVLLWISSRPISLAFEISSLAPVPYKTYECHGVLGSPLVLVSKRPPSLERWTFLITGPTAIPSLSLAKRPYLFRVYSDPRY